VNNVLPAYRDECGLSQGDLAELVDVSRQTINAIEWERYNPSLDLAFALADVFECRIEDLFQPNRSSND